MYAFKILLQGGLPLIRNQKILCLFPDFSLTSEKFSLTGIKQKTKQKQKQKTNTYSNCLLMHIAF